MRVLRLLPVLIGLSLLSGCGGGSTSSLNGTSSLTSTRKLHYTLTDLGSLPSASGKATRSASLIDLGNALVGMHGVTLNNNAQVVTTTGNIFDPQTQAQALFYHDGTKTGLGTLGGSTSFGYGLNDNGQAVGAASLAGDSAYHAFVYTQSQMKDIGTLGGTNSVAYAINSGGQIVGVSDTQTPDSTTIPLAGTNPAVPHLFLYQSGQMSDIGTLSGYTPTPYAISDKGVVVGSAVPLTPSASQIAFTYTNTFTPLPSLGGSISGAYSVNTNGLIVGQSSTTGQPSDPNFALHAVTWQAGKAADLGTLPNGNHSIAFGVNSQGDIVGGSTAEANSLYDHGFVLPHNGTMQDLNSLITPDANWLLLSAFSINEAGQIVGLGRLNNELHAYLLTPDTKAASVK